MPCDTLMTSCIMLAAMLMCLWPSCWESKRNDQTENRRIWLYWNMKLKNLGGPQFWEHLGTLKNEYKTMDDWNILKPAWCHAKNESIPIRLLCLRWGVWPICPWLMWHRIIHNPPKKKLARRRVYNGMLQPLIHPKLAAKSWTWKWLHGSLSHVQ